MKSYTSNRLKEKLDLVLNLFHCQGSQVRQGSQCGHGPQGNLKEINVVSVFRAQSEGNGSWCNAILGTGCTRRMR